MRPPLPSLASVLPLLLAGSVCSLSAPPAWAADVVREGSGQRRESLNKMELQPFPGEAWGKLSKWAGGDAVTGASVSGKPVLVCTWASWYPTSVNALPVAQQMFERYGKDGLIVVGVHSADGWEEAAQAVKDRGVTFPIAVDAEGSFRKTLLVDQDPDFYIIDRAGQLRFADVETSSVPEACATVVGETAAAAADVPKKLASDREQARMAAARTGQIRDNVAMRDLPELPFPAPSAEAYKAVTWPKLELGESGYGQGPQEPPVIKLADNSYFFPSKPAMSGRAQVLYFWHPSLRPSYDRVMDKMDQLQRERGRDLAVIGVLSQFQQNSYNPNPNPEEADPEKVKKRVEGFRDLAKHQSLTMDLSGGTLSQVAGQQGQATAPYAAVLSSDGTLRWRGDPRSPGFIGAVDYVISHDPGVKARRAAEDQYIKSRK
jgi:cytochrome c biogenesis protein CcmG, thiol:disulfide interchange protein DsbE